MKAGETGRQAKKRQWSRQGKRQAAVENRARQAAAAAAGASPACYCC